MPENRTLTKKYGDESMEEEKMDKELQLMLKKNLIITSLDGEGLIFDEETQKLFWANETAIFLLRTMETNPNPISIPFIKRLIREEYAIDDEEKISSDLSQFIEQLGRWDLVMVEFSDDKENRKKPKDHNRGAKKHYLKSIIKEEIEAPPVLGAIIRAAHTEAARSAAVSRATAAGFRGFR